MIKAVLAAACAVVMGASGAMAQEVRIAPDMTSASFEMNGQAFQIERTAAPEIEQNLLDGTPRTCPPFCITAMQAAPGVETVGELEVIAFLQRAVAEGRGLAIDSRAPDWFAKGTIPGAVNVPASTLEATNPYRQDILKALGAIENRNKMDFDGAMELLLFCNGPWCEDTPRAIQNLVSAGYPPEKLKYYRGGMQVWMMLGLTVQNSAS